MKLTINSNAIKFETEKASLIKLPKSNSKFWLTNRCCYLNGWIASIYINKDYEYYLDNSEKISGEDIIDAFSEKEANYRTQEVRVYEHIPEIKKAKKVTVDDGLKR